MSARTRNAFGRLRESRRTSVALFAVLLFGFLACRLVLAHRVLAPQVLCDEFVYADLAKSFAEHGRLLLRGVPSGQSLSYPIAIAPAWLFGSTTTAYALTKAINVVLFGAAGVIVYAWARRFVSPLLALVPAALLFAMPSTNYTALVMTESAFLPAFLGAAFAIALSLERPSLVRQLIALAAIALACTVRSQGGVLAFILVGAILFVTACEAVMASPGQRLAATARRVKAHAVSGGAVVAAALGYVVLDRVSPATLDRLGPITDVAGTDYTYAETKRWALLHLSDLVLTVGFVPMSALIILLGLALAGRLTRPAELAFVAVATASVPLVLVEVGAFTSRFAGSVSERYSFYLAPLLFLALALWIGRGLPRPPVATALAMVIPLAALGNEALKAFYAINLVPNSLGLYVFFRAGERLSGGVERVFDLILVGGLVAALAVGLLWRPLAQVLLPAAVFVFLLACSWPAYGMLAGQARNVRRAPGVSYAPQWVDAKIGRNRHATFLYAVRPDGDAWNASTIMLQVEFWNRSVSRVMNVGTPELCELSEASSTIDWRTGRIATADRLAPRYVVADASVAEIAGHAVATEGPIAVYRVAAPLRVAGTWTGLYGDFWTGPAAVYTRYATPGIERPRIRLHVGRTHWKGGPILRTHVHVVVGPAVPDGASTRLARTTASRDVEVHSGSSRTLTIPAPRGPFRVELTSDRTFIPSDYGSTDTRTLGVQAHITVERDQSARRATDQ